MEQRTKFSVNELKGSGGWAWPQRASGDHTPWGKTISFFLVWRWSNSIAWIWTCRCPVVAMQHRFRFVTSSIQLADQGTTFVSLCQNFPQICFFWTCQILQALQGVRDSVQSHVSRSYPDLCCLAAPWHGGSRNVVCLLLSFPIRNYYKQTHPKRDAEFTVLRYKNTALTSSTKAPITTTLHLKINKCVITFDSLWAE